jgi:hypothetical protein
MARRRLLRRVIYGSLSAAVALTALAHSETPVHERVAFRATPEPRDLHEPLQRHEFPQLTAITTVVTGTLGVSQPRFGGLEPPTRW